MEARHRLYKSFTTVPGGKGGLGRSSKAFHWEKQTRLVTSFNDAYDGGTPAKLIITHSNDTITPGDRLKEEFIHETKHERLGS